MNFKPLHDRVVIRRNNSDEVSKGGIIIPDNAQDKPQEGEILAVGSGARDETGKIIPLGVEVGDKVIFSKWSGSELTIDGEEVIVMKEEDIIGIVG